LSPLSIRQLRQVELAFDDLAHDNTNRAEERDNQHVTEVSDNEREPE
jgi:hypothetical protein